MATPETQIELPAFAKLVLHAMKYPHATVNGLLLGRQSKPGGPLRLVECVPLFHLGHGLTPMLELALLQVTAYCQRQKLQLLGYYQANQQFHELQPDSFAQKIGEKLAEQNERALIVMLNGVALADWLAKEDSSEKVLVPYRLADGKWKAAAEQLIADEPHFLAAIRDFIFVHQLHTRQLFDFDNHLEDVRQSWLNPQLDSSILPWTNKTDKAAV